MSRSWSQAELQILRDNYKKLSYAEISKLLIGKSPSAVKSKSAVLGIRISRAWPAEQIEVLKRNYATRPARAIADELGRGVSAVHGMAKKLGLKKADDWYEREESGRLNLLKGTRSRFEKGLTPWNKGRKTGPAHPNSKRTQFKKGQRPHNTLPIGTIVKRDDGYQVIKTADPNVWEFVHRREWEKHNGPIPEGHFVRFKDGNKANCDISNLMLETQTEHALRNSLWRFPEEIIPAMAALSDLRREIRNKKSKEEAQA